jgi:hypothetical protein
LRVQRDVIYYKEMWRYYGIENMRSDELTIASCTAVSLVSMSPRMRSNCCVLGKERRKSWPAGCVLCREVQNTLRGLTLISMLGHIT